MGRQIILIIPTLFFFPCSASVIRLTSSDASAHDVGKMTLEDLLASNELEFSDVTNKGKLYSCARPSGANVVRLSTYRECTRHPNATNMTEGIAVVFKSNIAPYIFNVTLYYKDISVITTWTSFFSTPQITNKYAARVPVSMEEIYKKIDKWGTCSNKAQYERNGQTFEAYDNDDVARDIKLFPTLIRSNVARSFHTTTITRRATVPSGYRSRTTVDCVVTYTQARSVYPYDYFALSTGATVEISPFWTPEKDRHNAYAFGRFIVWDSYQQLDLETGEVQSPTKRIFLREEDYMVSWEPVNQTPSVCTMAKWVEVSDAARVSYNRSYHFAFKDVTMSFVTNKTTFNISQLYLGDCVPIIANDSIERIYQTRYKNSHVKSGEIEYYLASGGFLIAFQKLLSNSLADLYLAEMTRRHNGTRRFKRSSQPNEIITSSNNETRINSQSSATFASLQFAYDTIQAHVNTLVGRIMEAWCSLQNRDATILNELRKINPSAVLRNLAGKPVSARLLGDVVAISKCIEVPIKNVRLQNSMRIPGDDTLCFSRPILVFDLTNTDDTDMSKTNDTGGPSLSIMGQLGENNEILSTRDLTETCKVGHTRYFLLGTQYLLYKDYEFVRHVNASEIEEINTFINLNLAMLEDIDIVPVEVYTREELRDVGTLNYDDVVRFQNMYQKMFRDIDRVIKIDNGLELIRGIASTLENVFGTVGTALGNTVMAVAGTVVSAAKAITSLFGNPFALLGIVIAVIVCIILGLLAFRYVSSIRSDPVRTLFPDVMKTLPKTEPTPPSTQPLSTRNDGTDGTDLPRLSVAELNDVEIAKLALLGIDKITKEQREAKNIKNAPPTKPRLGTRMGNFLRKRLPTNRSKGYELVSNDPGV
ncbi:envelope glycoprotein B [Psittacid alphaherpesvirus 5]|uniref:Envelope glycoprotein B n=1 Tax=Psittacid alphaherpesvirus 5 TaxID=2972693 RepID=A0A5P9JWY4_9ALPH|nr:envelope glycoprotein B [Psittacid alphaherpesvirus 5]QFU14564.1 envelope glycoprotein B [Psittacid alphaherpesvirus 5]UOO01035.1 envelope glycoprotein B [Psittacid alphaherpesvirus 5]